MKMSGARDGFCQIVFMYSDALRLTGSIAIVLSKATLWQPAIGGIYGCDNRLHKSTTQ